MRSRRNKKIAITTSAMVSMKLKLHAPTETPDRRCSVGHTECWYPLRGNPPSAGVDLF